MKDTIRHTFFFPHPAELVWDYLTKPELLGQWLMPGDIKPVVGHKFQFTTNPIPGMNFDGHIFCEVLEANPYTKLSYTWKGGPEPGVYNLDTIAMWTLAPKDNGTELSLAHSGFKDNVYAYEGMNMGWAKNIEKILTLLNQGTNE